MKKLLSQTKPEFILAMALVVVGISTRLLFYWLGIHNFNALTASVLFAGAYLQRSKWAYAIPLVMLLVTDAVIGFYDAGQMSVVYVSYALTLLIGMLYAKKPSLLAFAGVTLGGTAVFFLVSNFALWPFYNQYPHTFDGIIESYTLALPFVKNSLMSNMLFSAILFGSFEMAKVAVTKKVALAN